MWRTVIASIEIVVLSALILATRCANYREVFISGEIYFTDADCYSRMTRVRMCLGQPGIILRHHSVGTQPSLLVWALVSGAAWGMALWVSFYEPLILLAIVLIAQFFAARKTLLSRDRLVGWAVAGFIVLLGFAIERRLPIFPGNSQIFSNWASTIGELCSVSINDPVWLRWTGLLLMPLPALLWIAVRRTRTVPLFLAALLVVS